MGQLPFAPRLLLAVLASAAIPACRPTAPQGLDSPLPQQRMEAAVSAAEHHDESAVPRLVSLLDSDDPAVRLVAINSLEQITGQTLGYDYAASPLQRSEAADRWQRWATEHHRPAADHGSPAR